MSWQVNSNNSGGSSSRRTRAFYYKTRRLRGFNTKILGCIGASFCAAPDVGPLKYHKTNAWREWRRRISEFVSSPSRGVCETVPKPPKTTGRHEEHGFFCLFFEHVKMFRRLTGVFSPLRATVWRRKIIIEGE